MSKHARDYAPFKQVSAAVVLREDGTEVATIHAFHGNSCVVTVYNYGKDNPSVDCRTQSAGGYGYDKYTAALGGMEIDGHKLCNHCGESIPLKDGQRYFAKDSKPPRGYSYANWVTEDNPDGTKKYLGYSSCYKLPGLSYLQEIGYRVIRAI